MNQPDQVASPELLREHAELHHYTSLESLKGIVGSNTLWATNFEDLNDATEVIHLRAPLVEALTMRSRRALIRWRDGSPRRALDIERRGGVPRLARAVAGDLIDALYSTAFKSDQGPPLAVPYVTSFCSHVQDMEYERRNGLLSQWRGYGGQGGVCIVFDTTLLVEMLREEFNSAYWVHMHLDSAIYELDGQSVDQLFPGLVARCESVVASILENATDELPSDLFQELVNGSTRYKHRGFFEEREVRLVAIPAPASTLELMKQQHPDFEPGPLKAVATRPSRNRPIRYVTLFENVKRGLPINRVIVGPAQSQIEIESAVREILPRGVRVVRSATPYIA